LPEGPIGEAWDITDHPRGESVVDFGPFLGKTLGSFVKEEGRALLGQCGHKGFFPLMVKIIDSRERLSVQVHPDDALAQSLGVGQNGKTECWVFLANGGEVLQGTNPGVGRDDFRHAITTGRVAATLNHFVAKEGDVFFLPARTVHALGQGCFLYELQQTLDVTFRVYDWDRIGLDGKPRPLHVEESLATIDFSPAEIGPRPIPEYSALGMRHLLDCPYFSLDEYRGNGVVTLETNHSFVLLTCLSGGGKVVTSSGSVLLPPLRTALIPADAEVFRWEPSVPSTFLVARPGKAYFISPEG
jgi:mannose-6-phosphate isomerase